MRLSVEEREHLEFMERTVAPHSADVRSLCATVRRLAAPGPVVDEEIWTKYCESEQRTLAAKDEAATIRAELDYLRGWLANDAIAATFQSLGQYRTAALKVALAPSAVVPVCTCEDERQCQGCKGGRAASDLQRKQPPAPASGVPENVSQQLFDAACKQAASGGDDWPPVAATLLDASDDPALTLETARELLRDTAHGIQRGQYGNQKPRKHQWWGAGEPDCPMEIKASNGELHTLRCKVCGTSNPDSQCLATLAARDGVCK